MFGSWLEWSTALVFGAVFLLLWYLTSRPKNLPPGPPGHWLLGNLKDFGTRPELNFLKFSRQYGTVFRLYFTNRLMIVLNGYDVIKEALVNQADAFGGRPALYINNTVTGVNGLSQLQFGERRLKEQRKFAFSCLREIGRVGKLELEEKIAAEMEVLSATLSKLDGQPFEPYPVLFKAVSNIICHICFGFRFDYDDERFLTIMRTFDAEANPLKKASLIQFVPWLRFLPSNRRLLNRIFSTCGSFIAVIDKIIADHKHNFFPDNEPADVIDAFLREQYEAEAIGDRETSFTDKQLNWLVGDMIVAGSETTTRTLVWSLVLLVTHPEVYSRVQKEIDDVIGDARTPRLQDKHFMPYTEATMLEIFRYSSVAPLAVPHATTRDVHINGYTIPANTFVFINLWSINHDAKTWKNPETFDPNHFMNTEGKVTRPEAFMPFSGGVRVCPGEGLAKMDTFMFLTSLLQRFTFSLDTDQTDFRPEHSSSETGLPQSFKLKVKKRA